MYYNSLTPPCPISKAAAVHHNWHSENRNILSMPMASFYTHRCFSTLENCSVIYVAIRGRFLEHNTIILPHCTWSLLVLLPLFLLFSDVCVKIYNHRIKEDLFLIIYSSCTISLQQFKNKLIGNDRWLVSHMPPNKHIKSRHIKEAPIYITPSVCTKAAMWLLHSLRLLIQLTLFKTTVTLKLQ